MELSDFHDSFFEETEDLLKEMEQYLLDLDVDDPDTEQLHAIFRAAHSIKGGAGAFGFTVLQETTHLLENLLDYARHGQMTLRGDIVDVFLETKDILHDQMNAYRTQEAPDTEVFNEICRKLKAMAVREVEGEDGGASAAEPVDLNEAPAGTRQGVGSSDEAMLRICRTLQQIACEALGIAVPEDTPVQQKESVSEAGSGHRLGVTLLEVAAKDRELLLEELGHLGKVVSHSGDEDRFEVVLDTTEDADAIEAVMCFIIESSQLEIKPLAEPDKPFGSPVAEKREREEKEAEAKTQTEKASGARSGKAGGGGAQSSIRVPVNKVDQIINLVGELIISQSMLDQTAVTIEGPGKSALQHGLMQLKRTARDLQEAVMSVRMLPMEVVFSRYPRLVRDLAGKFGKQITLVTEGESTELDKGLIEGITDPLTHLVRNSLDHGIEMPDVREAAGKPRTGRLKLSARHMGGNILIEVSDDGGGLNREKILAKARDKGLEVNDDMSNDEVWQLIFAPGFSTAEAVSDVSGRGVGMDVVKRNIQALGGQVEIMSTPGEGTTIRVLLPLTLAILDGMSLRVGEEMFVLPLAAVSELIQPTRENLFTMAGDDVLLKVRDQYLPVLALHDIMQVPGAETDMTRAIAIAIYHEESPYALLVDEPVGQQQVVVKNLEDNYRKVPGASAATILGDGRVALILDPVALRRCDQARKQRHDLSKHSPEVA